MSVPNGDPEYDQANHMRKEKTLLNRLNWMPTAKLMDRFDTVQEITENKNIGKVRLRTETIERDKLFLRRLDVLNG